MDATGAGHVSRTHDVVVIPRVAVVASSSHPPSHDVLATHSRECSLSTRSEIAQIVLLSTLVHAVLVFVVVAGVVEDVDVTRRQHLVVHLPDELDVPARATALNSPRTTDSLSDPTPVTSSSRSRLKKRQSISRTSDLTAASEASWGRPAAYSRGSVGTGGRVGTGGVFADSDGCVRGGVFTGSDEGMSVAVSSVGLGDAVSTTIDRGDGSGSGVTSGTGTGTGDGGRGTGSGASSGSSSPSP